MIIAGYLRLSRDEDNINYDSILNQKQIIMDYAKNFSNYEIKFYEDNNVSGYTFDRPQFNKLKKDLENNKIDIVIAKDLSRIGRHNAKTLLFLEEVKNYNKRIILVEEGNGYDSAKDDDDILGIKTWYNERYIKDISKKIRSSINSKQKHGKFLIREYFGYKKDNIDKHKLIIDEETAWIVKLIFEKYINGMGSRAISNYLNDNKIPTPSQTIKQRYELKGKPYKRNISHVWYSSLVQRIIRNDIYAGVLRLSKTTVVGIKGKSIDKDEKDQYIFKDNHEPIISKEDFELAKKIMNQRKKNTYKGQKKNHYLFTGLIYCADCKKPIIGHTSQHKTKSYICTTYHNRGKEFCVSHRIKEDQIVVDLIKYIKQIALIYKDFINNIKSNQTKDYTQHIYKLKKDKKQLQTDLKDILFNKIKDIQKQTSEENKAIIEETYLEMEREKQLQIYQTDKKIKELESLNNNKLIEKAKSQYDLYMNFINKEKLNRGQVESIVNSIYVNKNLSLDIILNDNLKEIIEL